MLCHSEATELSSRRISDPSLIAQGDKGSTQGDKEYNGN